MMLEIVPSNLYLTVRTLYSVSSFLPINILFYLSPMVIRKGFGVVYFLSSIGAINIYTILLFYILLF